MLAYSSIAHTGYMLVGLAAYQANATGFGRPVERTAIGGVSALLYYMLAYTFMNIGAFAIITWLQHRGRGHDARRLRRSRPADSRWPPSR